MKNIGFLGLGSYLPENVVTNFDLEKTMNTTDEWIKTRTGIEQRHLANDNETLVHMSYLSSLEAIEDSGIDKSEIDLIIAASVTQPAHFPSLANQVQEKLGLENIPSFDVSAACSGFIYAVVQAYQFIYSNTYKNILVVGAERMSDITDWDDRGTAVLFGDGASSAIIGEVSEGKGILSFELGSNGAGGKHLYTSPKIIMNGREVFKFAVRQMPDSSENVVKKAGLTKEDVDFLIPHQANIRIIDASRKRLDLPEDKVSTTVKKHGNTSSASIPLALHEEVKSGNINDGDTIVLVGFGAGLTWGSICLKWGK